MEEIKVLFGETPILEGYSVEELLGMKPVLLVVLTPDGREYFKQVSPVTGMESWNGPLYAETVEEPLKPFKDEGSLDRLETFLRENAKTNGYFFSRIAGVEDFGKVDEGFWARR